ncbi:glycoside hydrolase family 43 protein [Pseudonocardia sp. MH-G8]|uniref:glycoside hydrolase family 43 protein n=1 Tax=Pseudonocardia sp. MH-G8 TaxID=1854588 RepID=UPI00117A1169|nr:glycoside hydrolase family 43 protein [Pseudonocardia sp. MH-G8]
MRFPWLARLLGTAPSDGRSRAPVSPVIARDFPDPDVVVVDGAYYAYSTNSGYAGNLAHLPVQRADALTGPWTEVGDGFPELPGWVAEDPPHVWAPELARGSGGGYLLYFTARHARHQVQCIGVASSESPVGPFHSAAPDALLCRPEEGDTIDAESFVAADGGRYLLYKSGRQYSSMWLQPMTSDGTAPEGERVELLRSDRPEEAGIVEAPTLVQRGDSYILFYSANTFDSGQYHVNYAVASSLTGPYTKADGALLTTDTIDGAYLNPGHQDVVATADGDCLVFHASISRTERGMFVAGLDWDADNRPSVVLTRPVDPAVRA